MRWSLHATARSLLVTPTPLETYLEGGPVAWATERQLELAGEALGKLRGAAPELAERIPNIHRIVGMRNVLVHGYLVLNDEVVWLFALGDAPPAVDVEVDCRDPAVVEQKLGGVDDVGHRRELSAGRA